MKNTFTLVFSLAFSSLSVGFAQTSEGISGTNLTGPTAATRLAFVQQPTNTTGGAIISPPVTVQLKDNSGNNVLQSGVPISLALTTGTGTLSGTTTRITNAQGLSTFDDLSINLIGSKRFTASSSGITSVQSNSFTVSVGPAARLEIRTQPSSSATAGTIFAQQPVLWVEDAGGNRLTGDNHTAVTAARLAGSGTLQGTLTASAQKGIVTFSNLSHNVAGTITILFTSGTLRPDTSTNIVILPATAARLTFVQQPTDASAGAIISPAIAVALYDAFGNAVTTSGTSVSLSLYSGTGTLSGTLTRSTVSGTATFDNLSINLAGTKTLRATSGSLTSATSTSFVISAGAATTLAFVQQPTNTVAASPITPPVTVQVRDSFGNDVAGSGIPITVAIASGSGTLSGATTQSADASGLATFSGLSINQVGSKTLSATGGGLVGATSATFTITAGSAGQLSFVQQPTNVTAGVSITPAVTIQVKDTAGNPVRVSGISVAMALTSGTGALTGTIPQLSDATGLVTFNNLSINLVGTKRITASSTGLTSAVSNTFTVLAASPNKLEFTTNPGGGSAGTPFAVQPVVTLEDAFGNPVSGVAQTVSLAIQNNAGPGGSLLGTKTATVNTATAQAVFANIAIDKVGIGYTLTATGSTVSTSPGSVVSTPFSVTAGAATKVRVENAADGTGTVLGAQNVTAGTSLTIQAITRDAYDNFIANVAADQWVLRDTTGGVRSTDLVASPDRKSATFTANGTGTGVIYALVSGLTSVPSGMLTVVVAGSPTKIRVETAANGSGIVVPSQSIESGAALTVFSIGRDAGDNFKANIAADTWTLVNKTGGVADGDLVVSSDRKSATFTGKLLGSAQIRATSGTLVPTNSGVLAVVAGAPASIAATGGTPQSTNVGTPFPVRLSARVRDNAGNPVKGVQVTWSAPSSGPSGVFAQGGSAAATDSNGIATSGILTANTVAGSYTITASVSGVASTASFFLTNLNGRPARIVAVAGSSQSTKINSQFAVLMAASVKDSSGNTISGVIVTFTAPATGPTGTFVGGSKTATATTNSSGIATAPAFTANSLIGNYQVKGTTAGVSDTVLFDLWNTAGQVGSIQAIGGTPQSTTVGAVFPDRLKATVRDSSGNPLKGVLVTFTAPSNGPSGRFTKGIVDSTISDTAGIATSTPLTANTVSGGFTVLARTLGAPLPASFALTNQPAPVDTFLIEAAGGGSIGPQIALVPFNIRVTANDPYGNLATQFSGTVDIRSNGILTQASGSTGPFIAGILASHTVALQNTGRFVLMATRTGGAETGRSDSFQVVNPAPTVRTILPAFGRRGQTLPVVIGGTGFISGVTAVSFGDKITTSTNVDSQTQLTVTITIDTSVAEGTRDVIVFNAPPGGGAVTLTKAFAIGSNQVPILTTVSPNKATVLQRLNVALTGDNFLGGLTRVDMGPGVVTHGTTVLSSTQLNVDITITSSAPGGIRRIAVVNDPPGGGTSDSVNFLIEAPSTPYPILESPPNAAFGVDTTVLLRWQRWLTGGIAYHLQLSRDSVFDSVVLEDSTITDTSWRLTSLLHGAMYYWRVFAWNQNGSSQPSPPRSFTTTFIYPLMISLLDTVAFPAYDDKAQYQPTDYRLVGLPGNSNEPISSFLSGGKDANWVVYWDNGALSDYLVPFSENAIFNFSAGRAFWVLHKGPIIVNSTVASAPLDSTGSVSIPLHAGWNLVANPFLTAIRWSSVQDANGPGPVSDLWSFKGSYERATTLMPFEGYMLDNGENRTSLRIPLFNARAKRLAGDDRRRWQIDIELHSGKFIDRATSIGVSPVAKEGRDPLDLRMPRGVGAIPGVSFIHPDWDSSGGVFATDIRPEIVNVETWKLDVRAFVQQPAQLSFTGVSRVPPEYRVALIDDDQGKSIDLRVDSAYRFTPAFPVSHLRVIVGTEQAVRGILGNVFPTEFALGNNFPNPFNPTTTVPVSVPQASMLELRVFTILGEDVRTLFRGSLSPGKYYFRWDGTDEVGRSVASGLYFIRLTTPGGRQFVGKMLLLR